ncbi:MAG TPA: hypothetical protein PKN48_04090 [Bacteroidales bacterium]|nr:hypothetical protein [Bacteroidales bacterium]
MPKSSAILVFCILLFSGFACFSQDSIKTAKDTITFSGQACVWGNYNIKNALPLQFGGHYIPNLDYGILFPKDKKLDFEVSLNFNGSLTFHPLDSLHTIGSVAPYRAWMRFSARQWEVRAGLQKINFGSATLLRPLMWFDQVDPRDPLQLTNGAWGLLFRYYFLNNANLWFWGLYGNKMPRPWDIGKTNQEFPELGCRLQTPVPKGEIALTYHFRVADMRNLGITVPALFEIPENRIGLDAKWDLGAGIWFEGAWINKSKMTGLLTNQEIFNIGVDNTFGIGNGLTMVFEQLLVANDEHAFAFSNNILFSALSLSYPIGMSDNINGIIYFEWKNKKSYNFINWNHKFNYFSTYLMAYWNPETYSLPQQGNSGSSYSGPGIQVMLVYNH